MIMHIEWILFLKNNLLFEHLIRLSNVLLRQIGKILDIRNNYDTNFKIQKSICYVF